MSENVRAAVLGLDDIPAAVVLLDAAQERVVAVNASAGTLLGVSGPLPVPAQQFLDAAQLDRLRAVLSDAPAEFTVRGWDIRTPLGERRRLAMHGRRDAQGRYVVVLHDRTADDRLADALRESEARWTNTAANLPGAVFRYLLRPDGTDAVMYMSHGCEDLWELSASRITMDASPMWEQVDAEDLAGMQASVMASAQALTPWDHRWRITTPSGKRKWLHGIGSPMRQADGSTLWDTLIFDVTAQQVADVERQRLHEQLEAARHVELVGRLAGGFAHDFNNLLTVILGGTDSALADRGVTDTARHELTHVLEATSRAANLSQQLLALAKHRPLDRGAVALGDALSALLPALERLVGPSVELRLEIAGSSRGVPLTGSQLDRVLSNLVLNAASAMAGRGVIWVVARDVGHGDASDRGSVIEVRDTGPGMSEAVQQRLFEPFFTTKGERGSGLGLSTVRGIVTDAGGRIACESQVGVGTTFTLWLPEARAVPVDDENGALIPVGRGERLLVVDDEPSVLRVTASALTRLGYQVFEASSAEDAVRLLGREDVALLLTDTVMPEVGGVELLSSVRRRWPHVKVVLMSGFVSDALDVAAVHDAAVGFLAKPFGRATLARTVRSALDA